MEPVLLSGETGLVLVWSQGTTEGEGAFLEIFSKVFSPELLQKFLC